MRKAIAVLGLALALIVPATGADYSTPLYTEDLTEDFEASGNILSTLKEENKVEILLKYQLEFVNNNYNRTDVNSLGIDLRGSGELISEKNIGSFELEYGGNRTEFITFKTDKSALVEGILFRVNHTATLSSGERTTRYASARIDYVPDLPEQKIESITTSATEVKRGQKIWFNATTDNIREVNVSGQIINVERGRFSGRIKIPSDLSEGIQNIPIRIKTGRANVFRKSLEIEVMNQPPNLTIDYPDKIGPGEQLNVTIEAWDDRNITGIKAEFRNKTLENITETLRLPTKSLKPGVYSFRVTAFDGEGKEKIRKGNFRVSKEKKDVKSESSEGKENEGEDEGGRIPVVRQFRKIMQSVVRAIIGMFL
ncbi:MAG: hypothetical protein SVV03_04235 [Candidatus Nanohaloarchaea archaeon]|nr:hypothetical protein [Candidatus Nanohaloarchaea archaeon]